MAARLKAASRAPPESAPGPTLDSSVWSHSVEERWTLNCQLPGKEGTGGRSLLCPGGGMGPQCPWSYSRRSGEEKEKEKDKA